MLRTNIEFSCDMPYDAVEGDGPDFIEMPGRTVAQAMAGILADLGCTVDAVESAGDHGWIFWFKFRSAAVSCEVTAIDGIVAIFHGPDGYKPLFRNAVPPNPDYVEILDRFGEAVDADPRFRDLGWFNSDELTGQERGARTATGEYDASPCKRSFGPDGENNETEVLAPDARAPAGPCAKDDWPLAGPIERLAARMFDHFVIVGGALSLLISFLRIAPPMPATTQTNYNIYLLFFSVALGGGIMGAVLLPRISTTPGKWLCRLRVVRADDKAPLSGAIAMKREAEVIVAGCAMFVPLLMPFTIGFRFIRWIYSGPPGWDRRRGSIVLQAPTPIRRLAATVFCLWSSLFLFAHLLQIWGRNPG